MAAMAIPLAIQLLPLIPPAIGALLDIIDAVKNDNATPEAAKLELTALVAELQEMKDRVARVELPTPGSGA